MNIEKMCEAVLCGGITIGVMLLQVFVIFLIDFTIYCLTGKCFWHLIIKNLDKIK